MKRQIFQSLIQFLTVFATGLAVYQGVPRTLDEFWQPFIQAAVSALAIWGGSKLTVGGAR